MLVYLVLCFIVGMIFGYVSKYFVQKLLGTKWSCLHWIVWFIFVTLMITVYIILRLEALGISGR